MGDHGFELYDGDLMGLCTNENHVVFRWLGPGNVLFSVTKKGRAASCHFASDKKGLRHLKPAIDEFVRFVFCTIESATMVLANIEKPSVGRLVEKIGFIPVASCDKGQIYMRLRDGVR